MRLVPVQVDLVLWQQQENERDIRSRSHLAPARCRSVLQLESYHASVVPGKQHDLRSTIAVAKPLGTSASRRQLHCVLEVDEEPAGVRPRFQHTAASDAAVHESVIVQRCQRRDDVSQRDKEAADGQRRCDDGSSTTPSFTSQLRRRTMFGITWICSSSRCSRLCSCTPA